MGEGDFFLSVLPFVEVATGFCTLLELGFAGLSSVFFEETGLAAGFANLVAFATGGAGADSLPEEDFGEAAEAFLELGLRAMWG